MSKDQKETKKKPVETVENFREYFNENFETIEISIKTIRNFQFVLERISKHLSNKKYPENLYKSGVDYMIDWINTSLDLHYSEMEFKLSMDKN